MSRSGKNLNPRIITEMAPELIERIDEWRYENRVPSRSEAIRRLIEAGLQATKPKQRK